MVLDSLGEKLRGTLQKLSKSLFVDQSLIEEIVRDIQRALIQADVKVSLVLDITKRIKERALKEELQGLDKKEHITTIVYEELASFMGGERKELSMQEKPSKWMLVGLYGSGKTTSAGKLAMYYLRRGKKVALVGLDVWRPAAMDQLEQVGKQVKVDTFVEKEEKDPLKIWKKVEPELEKYDLVIVDTAGRDALSDDLVEEIEKVTEAVAPEEKLLVISGDIGQAAETQAEQFHKSCSITGIIVTKMDGTAKGGGALTACAVTEAPIVFLGVGEKPEDLEGFNPEGFVSRLLGMGDISALMEKAEQARMDNPEEMQERFMKGDFDLNDLVAQMRSLKSMGSLSKLMEMIPGMSSKMPKEVLDVQEEKLDTWKYIIDSCTPKEKENPDMMSGSRVERVAKGSGRTVQEVRELLKHYNQSKKLMKRFGGSQKKMERMMKKMGMG